MSAALIQGRTETGHEKWRRPARGRLETMLLKNVAASILRKLNRLASALGLHLAHVSYVSF